MGSATTIQWATHTASPWYGCQHATLPNGTPHPGCLHCYAESGAKRSPATLGEWGPGGTRVVSQSFHSACRRWNKQAERSGVLASVFPSLCDPFEEFGGEIHVGKDVSMLRTRRGKKTTPLTLMQLQDRVVSCDTFNQEEMEWGGCGCALD